MPAMEVSTELTAEAERFDSYVLCDSLLRDAQTLPLAAPPLADVGTAGTAPALRRLAYFCNRLCAPPGDAAYFLAARGQLHRVAATEKGGRVDAVPAGLPGWPAAGGSLATLLAIREAPVDDGTLAEEPPCLLASDGKGQLWVCDDGGDPVGGGGAIPLPLPAGCRAAEGWGDWLLTDARWSASKQSPAGRVDVALLGLRPVAAGESAKRWCVLSVSIVLPSAASASSLHAAALLTAEEPMVLRCGAELGTLHCLLVIPPVWGGGEAAAAGSEEAAGGDGAVKGAAAPALAAAAAAQGGEDEEDVEEVIDCYSAAELRPGAGSDGVQLVVSAAVALDGFRPLASPSCIDLCAGAAVLCKVQRSFSALRPGAEQVRRAALGSCLPSRLRQCLSLRPSGAAGRPTCTCLRVAAGGGGGGGQRCRWRGGAPAAAPRCDRRGARLHLLGQAAAPFRRAVAAPALRGGCGGLAFGDGFRTEGRRGLPARVAFASADP